MSIDSGENGHHQTPADDAPIFTGGSLVNTHFQQRVINVSNAPPVSLKREKSGEWEIRQGSGGLVSCVDPVMAVNQENMWLSIISGKRIRFDIDRYPTSSVSNN